MKKEELSQKTKSTSVQTICVVGLGYVGLPLAVLLSHHYEVFGFDVNAQRINELQKSIDNTNEISYGQLSASNITFSEDVSIIARADFIIIAVPTPVDEHTVPDLTIVKKATEAVAGQIKEGAIVVYESTVYTGATEEECIPILESVSGMVCGKDFHVGYSPERVNPGDKKHTIDKVVKIISCPDVNARSAMAEVYGSITKVYEVNSMKVAEAAKCVENAQRDLNIAFINELTVFFNKIDISIYEVLDACKTKWNFLPFTPGFVGGHCIGVDPYYLSYKANEYNFTLHAILMARSVNESMHSYVASEIVKKMVLLKKHVQDGCVGILGVTFKENVPDVRNSKVFDLNKELQQYGINTVLSDPYASPEEVLKEYDVQLVKTNQVKGCSVLVVAVAHNEYLQLKVGDLSRFLVDGGLVVDIKRLFSKKEVEARGFSYWSL